MDNVRKEWRAVFTFTSEGEDPAFSEWFENYADAEDWVFWELQGGANPDNMFIEQRIIVGPFISTKLHKCGVCGDLIGRNVHSCYECEEVRTQA